MSGIWIRWVKFNAVGAIGIVVQLVCLAILTSLGANYLCATALAVETAVIHNFFWHGRFTWADRSRLSVCDTALRFAKFNVTTGVLSIVGNLAFMRLFAGVLHLPYLIANVLSIATCSIANFVLSETVVFRPAAN